MPKLSLHQHAAKLAHRLGLKVGLLLSAVSLAVFAFLVVSHYQFAVSRAVSSQVKSFSFWLQVNDRFQIQRSLADLVEAESLNGALVVDNRGQIIAQKSEPLLVPLLLRAHAWSAVKGGILLRQAFPLIETGLTTQREGELVSGMVIPYVYLGTAILFSILIITSSVYLTRKNFLAVATSLTLPVKRLAAAVELAGTLADLESIDGLSLSYAELDVLRGKMSQMGRRLVRQEGELREAERAKDILNLGRQVAHDIRSPVSALRMAIQTAKNFDPERKSLIISATDRIEQIASDLLDSSRRSTNLGLPSFALESACREILDEKKQMPGLGQVQFEVQFAGLQNAVVGHKVEFQRILSNLLNNSMESFKGAGTIRLRLESGTTAHLEVSDNGCGISEKLLCELNQGLTVTTKATGNGLGTLHARRTVQDWGGNLNFSPHAAAEQRSPSIYPGPKSPTLPCAEN